MGVIRTVVAVGALALSVPVYAQGGRFGGDRSRSEQKNDNRGNDRGNNRGNNRGNGRGERSADPRSVPRSESRVARRPEPRAEPRNDQRGRPADPGNRGNERADRSRYEDRGNRGNGNGYAYGRRDRDDRGYDRGYDRRVVYDYDRGRREAVFIGGWFRIHGVSISIRSHLASRDRYTFRRGLYVDPFVLTRLELLPFDLELQLGDLPPYYERRIYGRTVLVIDMRTRLVVDMYDVDW